jgi:hypothetical protein
VAAVAEAVVEEGDFDHQLNEEQGEVVILEERFAVSPGHGRFYPTATLRRNDKGTYVEPGDVIGEVRNGGSSIPVRSAFRGWVTTRLAFEGELVTPGQILVGLRPF